MKKLRSSDEIKEDLTVYKEALADLKNRQRRGDAPMSGYDTQTEWDVDNAIMYYKANISVYKDELKELKRYGEQLTFDF